MSARSTQAAKAPAVARKNAPKRRTAAARAAEALPLPERRSYAPRLEAATMADLPFTQMDEAGDSLRAWAPAKVKSYGEACLLGAEYAAHWLQFVKDNGSGHYVYTLSLIVREMGMAGDDLHARGCIIGFFAHIERVVRGAVQNFDVFQDLDLATAHLRPQQMPAKEGAKRGRIT